MDFIDYHGLLIYSYFRQAAYFANNPMSWIAHPFCYL